MSKRNIDNDMFSSSDDSEASEPERRHLDPSEESEGEDLNDHFVDDYRQIPELDRYESDGMSSGPSSEVMTHEQRMEVERQLDERDYRAGYGRRLPRAFDSNEEEEAESSEDNRDQRFLYESAAQGMQSPNIPISINTSSIGGSLKDILLQESVKLAICKRFTDFLYSFVLPESEQPVDSQSSQYQQKEAYYINQIREMCTHNYQSLEVSFMHISTYDPQLAIWLADEPRIILQYLKDTTRDVVFSEFKSYSNIHDTIYVRIVDLPIMDQIRDLRTLHLGSLIQVKGVITRRTSVFPQLQMLRFVCKVCNNATTPIPQNTSTEVKPPACTYCGKKTPMQLDVRQTVYRNYQKITLQESPGSVPAGRIPRSKEVILTGDLIDIARPGEEVTIIGRYTNNFDMSLNTKNGFPVFSTVIEANNVKRENDVLGNLLLSQEDIDKILALSKDHNLEERILASIAPFIFRHRDVKMAIALSLFGGKEKITPKHRIRGDINVLLLGDPGTAKSQFLKYAEQTAPRSVYTTGKGASAVGLTASVHRDAITREWTLEGGALVLADRGVCLIDEFDKMNDADRVSIHEAMEQQSISISKAGIVASLQARCSVIAAANPKTGRYDGSKTFAENVDLTDPILQRFDLLCVLQDIVDPIEDERLASFVVENHIKSHPNYIPTESEEEENHPKLSPEGIELIPQDLLKKYIVYARSRVHPILEGVDQEKISKLYAELRQESVQAGGVPIAVRHIESIIRMSEAHARMFLRDHVLDDDIDAAIKMMLSSFINAQKYSVKNTLRKTFQKYIIAMDDVNDLLMTLLLELVNEKIQVQKIMNNETLPTIIQIPITELEQRALELGIQNTGNFFRSEMFESNNFSLSDDHQTILRSFV